MCSGWRAFLAGASDGPLPPPPHIPTLRFAPPSGGAVCLFVDVADTVPNARRGGAPTAVVTDFFCLNASRRRRISSLPMPLGLPPDDTVLCIFATDEAAAFADAMALATLLRSICGFGFGFGLAAATGTGLGGALARWRALGSG